MVTQRSRQLTLVLRDGVCMSLSKSFVRRMLGKGFLQLASYKRSIKEILETKEHYPNWKLLVKSNFYGRQGISGLNYLDQKPLRFVMRSQNVSFLIFHLQYWSMIRWWWSRCGTHRTYIFRDEHWDSLYTIMSLTFPQTAPLFFGELGS